MQGKLAYFPTPYPDELFYNLVARYHVWSRNHTFIQTSQDLFGSKSVISKVALPNRLDFVTHKLSANSLLTSDTFIYSHTLFPLFKSFLPKDRNMKILNSMKSDKISASLFAGIQQSVVPTNHDSLHFCPLCLEEDRKTYGEAYWHRTHQVFGVKVCPKHQVLLIKSNIFIVDNNYQSYHLPNETLNTNNVVKVRNRVQIDIAKDIYLLLNKKMPEINLLQLNERYFYYLKKRKLATFSGYLKEKQLVQEFIEFYGADFLNDVNCSIVGKNHWLTDLLRKKKIVHPLKHILFIKFLGLNLIEFFEKEVKEELLFGKGPWICFNAASNHYLKPVITQCKVKRGTSSKGAPVGTFTCECGFSYSRKCPSGGDKSDLFKVGHIVNFGHVWERELIRLRKQEKKTIKEISSLLRVTPLTIIRKLKNLEENSPKKEKQIQELQQKYRHVWLRLVKQYPNKTQTGIRQIAKKEYIWLYRHDFEWLKENSPKYKKQKVCHKQSIWDERDLDYSKKVLNVVEQIKNCKGRPVKITLCSIGRQMGVYNILVYGAEKLPKTMALINSKVETNEEYRVRRIAWASEELYSIGETLTPSKISKRASIPTNILNEKLKHEIGQQMMKMYNTPDI